MTGSDWCLYPGCTEPATDWYVRYEGTLENGVGYDIRVCAEHHDVQKAETEKYCLHRFQEQNYRMRYWTLDTFPADDEAGIAAKEAALEWKKGLSSECNLIIHGSVGSGKSGLAWAIGRDIAISSHWDPPKFVNVRQLLTSIRRSFSTEAADPMDGLIEVFTLVLDDLGAERVTDWTREWLATLIEGRYVAEHPTIVTSNYSPAQLARRLGHDDPVVGKRIVSRLVENAEIIKLDRADLRLRRGRVRRGTPRRRRSAVGMSGPRALPRSPLPATGPTRCPRRARPSTSLVRVAAWSRRCSARTSENAALFPPWPRWCR